MALDQLLNNADIIDQALDIVGEPVDGTSEFESQALSLLNEGYRALVDGGTIFGVNVDEEWLWLQKSPPTTITLQPRIDTIASIDNGSQALTLSETPVASIDSSIQTWFYKSKSLEDVFRIATHDGVSAVASLDSIWTGDTVTGDSGTVYKLEYDLPSDFLRFYTPMRTQRENEKEITIGTEEALDRDFPITNIVAGVPTRAAFVDDDSIRFNRYPGSNMIRVEVPYLFDPPALQNATSDTPLMPVAHYVFLKYYIAHFLAVIKEDFDKASIHQQSAVLALNKMVLANRKRKESGQRNLGKILPRQKDTRRQDFPVRTISGFLITG